MPKKLDEIVEKIAKLSVLDLSKLVKVLEEKFGVEAAATMMMGAMPAAAGGVEAAEAEEPTSFDVILKEIGQQKIQVIKEVRAITGLGLKEAKVVVDSAPSPVKEGLAADEAKQIREKLEAVGAVIEVKAAS